MSTSTLSPASAPPRWGRLALVAVASLSLVLDRGVEMVVQAGSMPSWLVRLSLPSLVVALALYLATGPGDSWRLPTRTLEGEPVSRRARVVTVAIWLGVMTLSVGVALLMKGTAHIVDAVGFAMTHPLAMTLLFQGALVQLAARWWPARTLSSGRADQPWRAMLVVAVIQGASQLQYSGLSPSLAVAEQIVRVFVLGFIFCSLRFYFGSLWTVTAAYAINAGMAMR